MDSRSANVQILEIILLRLLRVHVCVDWVHTSLIWDVYHFDVEQACVSSNLDGDHFLRLFKECGSRSGKIVRLYKSLYGLKKASPSWHVHFSSCLKN